MGTNNVDAAELKTWIHSERDFSRVTSTVRVGLGVMDERGKATKEGI
jgi:hypothetical protein